MSRKILLLFILICGITLLSGCVSYDNTLTDGIIYKKTFTSESTDFLIFKNIVTNTYTIYYKKEASDNTFIFAYQDVTVDEFYGYDLNDEYTRKAED